MRKHEQGYEPVTPVAREINTTCRVSGSAAAYLDPRQKKHTTTINAAVVVVRLLHISHQVARAS
jgi:hypothetical protein